MPSHRSLRIAEAIREVVSSAILFEVSDPRVRGVTILSVEGLFEGGEGEDGVGASALHEQGARGDEGGEVRHLGQ